MIVRDEEHNLTECLTPVAHLFDEIVIVDTGSKDRTKEIARQFTPHVHDFAWCDDFAAARNESLKHATGEWIFWLDADDRVLPQNVAKLTRLFETQLDDQPRAFFMDTVIRPREANKDVFVTSHARLFRRHPELAWQGRVHEQLRPEPEQLGYRFEQTHIQIEHIGYQEQAVAGRKARRKLRLLRMDYAMDPNDVSTLLHMAIALAGTGARKQAKEALLKLVTLAESPTEDRDAPPKLAAAPGGTQSMTARLRSQPHLRRVYSALADLALHDGRPDEAVRHADEGLAIFPDDVHLMFAEASGLYALENHRQAADLLETILTMPPSRYPLIGAVADVQSKLAPRMLAAVRRMQGAFNEAERLLSGVLARFPDDVTSWYNLGLVYLDQRNGLKLAPVVSRLADLPNGRVDAGTLAALWQLRHGDVAAAGPLIDSLIAEAPNSPCPRMLRAEWLSKTRAAWNEQLRALKDVVRVQPGNVEARKWIELVERQCVAAGAVSVMPAPAMSGMAVG